MPRRIRFSAICCLILAACQPTISTSNNPAPSNAGNDIEASSESHAELFADIEALVEAKMDEEKLPGVAVILVKEGQTIFSRGYGYADYFEQTPVSPDDSVFRIGSITKPLTALGIMKLVEQERLSLNDDIGQYLGDIEISVVPGVSGDPIKIWNLLTHTSGFDQIGVNRFDPDLLKDFDERRAERPSLQAYLADNNLRQTVPAGSHYRYDTYGITLAGHILEQITGKPYDDAMDELVFEPAGMSTTSVGLDPDNRTGLVRPHGLVEGEFAYGPYELYYTQPASSIEATPSDMGRLLEALTGGGITSEGNRLFSAETVEDILSVHYRPHPDFSGMTHGFVDEGGYATANGAFPREVGHGGTTYGFRTSLTIFPEKNVALFVAVNRNFETGGDRVMLNGDVFRLVRAAFFDVPEEPRFEVPAHNPDDSVSEYIGNYFYDVFCSTCSPTEIESGAWQQGSPVKVSVEAGALIISGKRYVRQAGDLFVSDDGTRRVFFRRDLDQQVLSFSWNSSPDAFARYGRE
ncbi:MAG: serine hydrolase domain-containing protein [Pseudomonadota bacterium]